MFGIIYQKRQDLRHISLYTLKRVYCSSNFIRFWIVKLLIQDMRRCFRYESLMFLAPATLCFICILYANCVCWFVQINTRQMNTIQYNTIQYYSVMTSPIHGTLSQIPFAAVAVYELLFLLTYLFTYANLFTHRKMSPPPTHMHFICWLTKRSCLPKLVYGLDASNTLLIFICCNYII